MPTAVLANGFLQASSAQWAPWSALTDMARQHTCGASALDAPKLQQLQRIPQRSVRTSAMVHLYLNRVRSGSGLLMTTAKIPAPAHASFACASLADFWAARRCLSAVNHLEQGSTRNVAVSAAVSGRRRQVAADGGNGDDPAAEPTGRPAKRRSRAAATALSYSAEGEGKVEAEASRSETEPARAPKRASTQASGSEDNPAGVGTSGAAAVAASEAGIIVADLSALKVTELQALLQQLGLPRTGRKAELVERLKAAPVTHPGPADRTAAKSSNEATAAAAAQGAESEVESKGRVNGARPAERPPRRTGAQRVPSTQTAARSRAGKGTVSGRGAGDGAGSGGDVADAATTSSGAGTGVGAGAGGATAPDGEISGVLEDLFGSLEVGVTVTTQDASLERAAPRHPAAAVRLEEPSDFGPSAGGRYAAERTGPPPTSFPGRDAGRRQTQKPPEEGVDEPARDRAASRVPDPLRLRQLGGGKARDTDGNEVTRRPDTEPWASSVSERRAERPHPGQLDPTRKRPSGAAPDESDLNGDEGPPPDLDNLPPWPEMFMGQVHFLEDLAPGDQNAQDDLILSNATGISLTSLGSAAGCPTALHGLGCLAMVRTKEIFIFDAGDDTQRQLGAAYHVKPSKIHRIFLTSLSAECSLGLPGLLCIVNSARERGHEMTDIPVHVYGPPGTADFVATVMRLSQTLLEITTVVHEVWPGPVSEEEATPHLYASRSRIWRVVMPPDQLNPRGGVDASLMLFAPDQGRGQKKKGRNASGGVLSHDPRAGFLPWPPLQPGDPSRSDVDPLSMTWTLELDVTARTIINLLPGSNGQPTLVYTVLEAKRAGGLVVERTAAAGLIAGRDFSRLKAGETVTNRWGQSVDPSLVISPTRPGRRVVVLGNTIDPTPLAAGKDDGVAHKHMQGADVLVAGAVYPKAEYGIAAQRGGCTADVLGGTARRLGVRHVLLARFDGRRFDGSSLENDSGYAAAVAAEVQAAMRSTEGCSGAPSQCKLVAVLEDMKSIVLEKNEGLLERE